MLLYELFHAICELFLAGFLFQMGSFEDLVIEPFDELPLISYTQLTLLRRDDPKIETPIKS